VPMNTLRPIATTNSVDLPPSGAATAHAALSDANDGTFVAAQVSVTDSTKQAWHTGPGGLTALPAIADRITGTVISIRGRASDDVGAGTLTINGGAYPSYHVTGSRFANGTGDGAIATTVSGSLGLWTKASQVAAAGWLVAVVYDSGHNGNQGQITDLWFDVTWEPTLSVFKGMILGAMGPLVGVGLLELPAIAREVWRRTGTRILPREYAMAWRALREVPGRRIFDLGGVS
jgi:hypothetical protein